MFKNQCENSVIDDNIGNECNDAAEKSQSKQFITTRRSVKIIKNRVYKQNKLLKIKNKSFKKYLTATYKKLQRLKNKVKQQLNKVQKKSGPPTSIVDNFLKEHPTSVAIQKKLVIFY